MPEIEIFDDKTVMVGKRRKGKDESLEDAMKTMERFSDWLSYAQDSATNVWAQSDAISAAMLYGMLLHLRDEIDQVLASSGDEVGAVYQFFAKRGEAGAKE